MWMVMVVLVMVVIVVVVIAVMVIVVMVILDAGAGDDDDNLESSEPAFAPAFRLEESHCVRAVCLRVEAEPQISPPVLALGWRARGMG